MSAKSINGRLLPTLKGNDFRPSGFVKPGRKAQCKLSEETLYMAERCMWPTLCDSVALCHDFVTECGIGMVVSVNSLHYTLPEERKHLGRTYFFRGQTGSACFFASGMLRLTRRTSQRQSALRTRLHLGISANILIASEGPNAGTSKSHDEGPSVVDPLT